MITKDKAKETIDAVLNAEPFGIKTVEYWEKIKETKEKTTDNDWIDAFIKWLKQFFDLKDMEDIEKTGYFISALGEFLVWLAVGIAIGFLIYQLVKNQHWFKQLLPPKKKRTAPPSQLFGLAVDKKSLPPNIVESALALLQAGQLRDALSLLYRGALARFIHDHQIELLDSLTEMECAELVNKKAPENEAQLFKTLTETWLVYAYGHLPLSANQIEQLCQQWQPFYAIEIEKRS